MNELSEVVDKLAEKIGVAGTKLQPIAEECLKQYGDRALLWAVASLGLVFVVGVVVIALMFRTRQIEYDDDDRHLVQALIIFGGTALWAGLLMAAVVNLGHAIAPLPSILGL